MITVPLSELHAMRDRLTRSPIGGYGYSHHNCEVRGFNAGLAAMVKELAKRALTTAKAAGDKNA